MSAIDDLPPLRDVIRRHGLNAKKSLGQNFLLDLNLTARIARAAGPLQDVDVVEVGPGPGGLTRALLAAGARHVIAIERDDRALAALAEIAARYPGRLGDRRCRRARLRSMPPFGRCAGARRRKPALQYRDRLARALAHLRAVAALVRSPGVDVSARGRRAPGGEPGIEKLRKTIRAGWLAHRSPDSVRHRRQRLRAAAEGDVLAGRN